MKKYATLAADVIKYFAIVGLYLFLQDVDPLKGWGQNLQNKLVTALFSAVASLVLLDVIFGRPVLSFSWQIYGRPALGGSPELHVASNGKYPEIGVTMKLEGSGVLYEIVKWVAKSGKVNTELKFTPSRSVMAELQHGGPHHTFNVHQDTLTTNYADGFTDEGTFPAGFVFMLPQVSGVDRKIGCKVSWKCSGRLRRVFLHLAVKRSLGISGFYLRGN